MKTAFVCLIALLWVAHSVLSAPADGPPPDTVPSTAPVPGPEGSDLKTDSTFGFGWGWGWPFWGGYGGWGWGGRWGWGGGWGGGYGGGWW